jgi:hypothetical protein
MNIDDWNTPDGVTSAYRRVRELGLETNLAELEAFGFTVVEPEKTGAPPDFAGKLLDAVMAIADKEDRNVVSLNAHETRPAYGRQLFHLLNKDPIFVDAVMNPVSLAIGTYFTGASCRLYNAAVFLKEGEAKCTHLHSDSTGVPPPLPFYGNLINISWILTDYTLETGTLCMAPGSHRLCRHPTPGEQPRFMGGPGDDSICVPLIAKPGSLAIFNGNTWHGSYPKNDAALRVHFATGFCRNYVNPAEDFSDIPESTVARGGAEFARLIGRTAWQGFGSEGPKLEHLALVRNAHASSHG